jgi:excisionase family DNA binding protein
MTKPKMTREQAIGICRAAILGRRCPCGGVASWRDYVAGSVGIDPTVWPGCSDRGHKNQAVGGPVSRAVFEMAIGKLKAFTEIADLLDNPPIMTVDDAADFLEVTPGRIKQLIESGAIRGEKWGPAWMVDRLSVHAYSTTPRKPGRPKKPAPTE